LDRWIADEASELLNFNLNVARNRLLLNQDSFSEKAETLRYLATELNGQSTKSDADDRAYRIMTEAEILLQNEPPCEFPWTAFPLWAPQYHSSIDTDSNRSLMVHNL
jgi:hypothetical protein